MKPICDGSAFAAAVICAGLSAADMIRLNGATAVPGSGEWQTWQYVLYSALPAAASCAPAAPACATNSAKAAPTATLARARRTPLRMLRITP